MKKFYFMLIAAICLVIPAKAAVVTDLSQLSDDKVYTIRSTRAFLLFHNNTLANSCQWGLSLTGQAFANLFFFK